MYQLQQTAQLHLSVYKPHTTHCSSIRCDEGLTLETSDFESLYGSQFTISTQLIKPNYFVILPTDAAPQFLWKLGSSQPSIPFTHPTPTCGDVKS